MLVNEQRARQVMSEHGLDALLATTPENVFYLSELESVSFLISRYTAQVYVLATVDTLSTPTVISGLGDVGAIFQVSPPGTRSIHYGSFYRGVDADAVLDAHELRVKARVVDETSHPNSLAALKASIVEAGLQAAHVGYDEKGLDPSHIPEIRAAFPQISLTPSWQLFRDIRAVKSAEEIDRLQQAVRLTEQGILAANKVAVDGCQEEDLIREYRRTVVSEGGSPLFNEITFGRRSAVGSLPRQDGVLRSGDYIRYDVGCRVGGYCSDISRLFGFEAEPPRRIREMYDAILAGEKSAIEVMRPGVPASQVFERAVASVRASGEPEFKRHHVGHAIGIEVYEVPLLAPHDDRLLEAGMVFEVETPLYVLGRGGVQVEDTVLVTDGGPRLLTTLPRDIATIESRSDAA